MLISASAKNSPSSSSPISASIPRGSAMREVYPHFCGGRVSSLFAASTPNRSKTSYLGGGVGPSFSGLIPWGRSPWRRRGRHHVQRSCMDPVAGAMRGAGADARAGACAQGVWSVSRYEERQGRRPAERPLRRAEGRPCEAFRGHGRAQVRPRHRCVARNSGSRPRHPVQPARAAPLRPAPPAGAGRGHRAV